MTLIVPKSAELDSLSGIISGYLSSSRIRLYGSDVTIGANTTLASLLAAEVTFSGYAPVAATTWTTPVLGGTNDAETSCVQGTWTPTGGGGTGSLYGYFLTDAAGTKWYGAERFAGAPLSSTTGVPFNMTATMTALSQS